MASMWWRRVINVLSLRLRFSMPMTALWENVLVMFSHNGALS